jgi:hypothetical protein
MRCLRHPDMRPGTDSTDKISAHIPYELTLTCAQSWNCLQVLTHISTFRLRVGVDASQMLYVFADS